jgi:actin-related protein
LVIKNDLGGDRVSIMSKFVLPKKNFTLPAVSEEAMALPAVVAFHAAVEQAAEETNALLEEARKLTRELACLKRAKKKASQSTR